jgi:DeoR family transcriptional regulator, fructose operon transcriptional repressor
MKERTMTGNTEAMFSQTRRKAILELVTQQSFITVNELCERFGMSAATIRNDLRQLEALGRLERMHGGAISPAKTLYEPDTIRKEVHNVRQKEAIARLALAYIHPGDVIALDTGTTTFELAKLLRGIERLTVVTYDLQIAAWLESNTDVAIIMVGGQVRRNFHCTAGQTVIETLSRLHVDRTFSAANGITAERGLSTPNLDMASIKATLIGCAGQVILLCDSGKIGHNAFVSFAPLDRVDVLITDSLASPAAVKGFEGMGVTVKAAKVN